MSITVERIIRRRKELSMSQEELAAAIGYKDKSSICRIESGEREIRQSTLLKIAEALKVSVPWLMGYDEENPPAPQPTAEQTAIIERIKKLNPEQIEQASKFVEFLISQRENHID